LLIATTMGTPAARACETASSVCGRIPSSAATMMIAMSVTRAPRARIAEKACARRERMGRSGSGLGARARRRGRRAARGGRLGVKKLV
jgi:hypothetical protein